jgi:hypothetical protein
MEVERLVPVQGALPLLCRPDNPGTASRSCPMGGAYSGFLRSGVGRWLGPKGPNQCVNNTLADHDEKAKPREVGASLALTPPALHLVCTSP